MNSLKIILGRHTMSFQAMRLIHYVFLKLIAENKDFRTFNGKLKEIAEIADISMSNIYRDINKMTDIIHSHYVFIGEADERKEWEILSWLNNSYYDGSGNLSLKLSNAICNYLLDYMKYISSEEIESMLKFKSYYSIRLYEVLLYCSRSGNIDLYKCGISFSTKELRNIFDCNHKYKLFSNFKNNTIEIAVKDIELVTGVKILTDYKRNAKGTVTNILFSIESRK